MNALKQLAAEIGSVSKRVEYEKGKGIPAQLWVETVTCSARAQALTERFKTAGWLEHEYHASKLWARATLIVTAHYHNMVGPAVLANADCCERRGLVEEANNGYKCIVADFQWIANDLFPSDDGPNNEDFVALQCLEQALARLLASGITKLENGLELVPLRERTVSVLARPESD